MREARYRLVAGEAGWILRGGWLRSVEEHSDLA
jgi:hypothetical protein